MKRKKSTEKQEKKEETKKSLFLPALLACMLAGFGGIYLISRRKIDSSLEPASRHYEMPFPVQLSGLEKITFEQAVKDEGLRQRYLERTLAQVENYFRKPHGEIADIVYDPDSSKARAYLRESGVKTEESVDKELKITRSDNGHTHTYTTTNLDWFGLARKHRIFVFPSSFEITKNNLEFTSLVGHEYFHVLDFYTGISLPNNIVINNNNMFHYSKKVLEALIEVRAYNFQLNFLARYLKQQKSIFVRTITKNYYEDYASLVKLINEKSSNNTELQAMRSQLEQLRIIPTLKEYKGERVIELKWR